MTISSSITDRGFTDHEHLDDWELIHMNGRGYDYNLGRSISIDTVIQSPGNSQSINGFAYIMNNPLSGIDRSGHAVETKVRKIRRRRENSRTTEVVGAFVTRTVTDDETGEITSITSV